MMAKPPAAHLEGLEVSDTARPAQRVAKVARGGLALPAMALTVMAGCARVSTEHVEKSSDQLPRPRLVLVHDYQILRDAVQLDSAVSSRI
jgi:hypothetical protein